MQPRAGGSRGRENLRKPTVSAYIAERMAAQGKAARSFEEPQKPKLSRHIGKMPGGFRT